MPKPSPARDARSRPLGRSARPGPAGPRPAPGRGPQASGSTRRSTRTQVLQGPDAGPGTCRTDRALPLARTWTLMVSADRARRAGVLEVSGVPRRLGAVARHRQGSAHRTQGQAGRDDAGTHEAKDAPLHASPFLGSLPLRTSRGSLRDAGTRRGPAREERNTSEDSSPCLLSHPTLQETAIYRPCERQRPAVRSASVSVRANLPRGRPPGKARLSLAPTAPRGSPERAAQGLPRWSYDSGSTRRSTSTARAGMATVTPAGN